MVLRTGSLSNPLAVTSAGHPPEVLIKLLRDYTALLDISH